MSVEESRRIDHDYRVRFDEADADGWLRPSGLLRYAQDMASRHSEEAGFERDWYEERGMIWLVRNVSLSIREPATYGDVLSVSSEVIGWRHVWARRRAEMRRVGSSVGGESGDLVAIVDTDWVMLTTEGRPARVPEEFARHFSSDHAFTRSRVLLPDPTVAPTTLSTRVRPLDVDPMRHMNNAAYLDMAEDALARMPEPDRLERPDCYRIGYLQPALPGTPIEVSCWPVGDDRVACRISDGDGAELTKMLVSQTGG